MPRSKTLVILALCWVAAAPSQAASVEEARRLYQNGDELAARGVLIEILALETDGVVRAQALDLVGMIAVDEGDLDLAAAVWKKLISDFPDSPEATEAKTKLSLSTDLGEARAAVPEADRAAAPVEAEKTAPVPAPMPADKVADQVASQPTEEAEPTQEAEPAEPAAPAAPKQRAPQSDLVLVAGRGKPHDGAQRAAEVIIEHLQSRGVAAESATKGVPVVEKSALVIPALLRQAEEEGASGLLLVTSNFESLAKVVVECYTPEGALAWKKKVTGGTGWQGRPYSASGMNEALVDRVLDKLDGQVGQPCLVASE
jgi:pyruvate/2-oxoglutarate dehydrogenase complex dihydrolipoamide acyltransferase (E2) component